MKNFFLCNLCAKSDKNEKEKYKQIIRTLKEQLSAQRTKQFNSTVEMNRIKNLIENQTEELVDLLEIVDTMGHQKGNEGFRIQMMSRLKNMYVYSKMVEQENFSLY